jgi:Protein of unknown function (DUF2878)
VNVWINAIFYQATWIIAIGGAARGWWWAGPAALAVFAAWQIAVTAQRRADAILVLYAAALGFAIDSFLAQTGMLSYAAAVPWPNLAPAWIIALWVSFALTLNHSLAYLKLHPRMAAAFGGIGAPLAYWAAWRWGALSFPASSLPTLAVLAVAWAALTPALSRLALVLSQAQPRLALNGSRQ